MMKKVLSIVLTVCMLFTMVVIPTVTATAATTVTNPEGQSAWKFDFSAEGGYFDYDNPVSPEGVTYDWTAVGYGGNYKIEQTSDFRRAELNTPMDALRIRMEGDRRNMSLVPLLPNGQPIVLEPGKTYTVNINFYISGSGAEDRPLIAPFSTLDGYGDRTNYSTNAKNDAGNKLPLRSATNFGSHRSLFSDSQTWYYNPGHWVFGSSYGEKYTPKMLNEEGVLVDGPEATINRGMGYRSVGYTDNEKTITFTVPTLEQLESYNVTVNEDGSYAYNGHNFNNFFALEFTGVLNNEYYGLYASAKPNSYADSTPAADFIGKAYESALTKGEDANGNKYFKMFSEFYITSLSVIEVQNNTGAAVFHELDGKTTTFRGANGTAIDLTYKPTVPTGKEFLGWYTDAACTKPATSATFASNKVVNFYASYGTLTLPATNPEGESAWIFDFSEDGGYFDYANPVDPSEIGYDWTAVGHGGNYKVEHGTIRDMDALRVRMEGDSVNLNLIPLKSDGRPVVMEAGKTYAVDIEYYVTGLGRNAQRPMIAPYSTVDGSGGTDRRTNAKKTDGTYLPLETETNWVNSHRSLFSDGQIWYLSTGDWYFTEQYFGYKLTNNVLTAGAEQGITRGMGFVPNGYKLSTSKVYSMPTEETLKEYQVSVNKDGSYAYNGKSFNNFFAIELIGTHNNDYYGTYTDGSTGTAYDSALTKGTDANGTKYFKMFSEYYITKLTIVEVQGTTGAAVFHEANGATTTVRGENGTAVDLTRTPTVIPADQYFEGWYTDAACTIPATATNYATNKVVNFYAKFATLTPPATNPAGEKVWNIDLSENGYFDYENPVNPGEIEYDWTAVGFGGDYDIEKSTYKGFDAMRVRADGDRTFINIVPLKADGTPIVMEAGKTYQVSVSIANTGLGISSQRISVAPYSTVNGVGNQNGLNPIALPGSNPWVPSHRGLFMADQFYYCGDVHNIGYEELYAPMNLTGGALAAGSSEARHGMAYDADAAINTLQATYAIPSNETLAASGVTVNSDGSYAYNGNTYNNFLSIELPTVQNQSWIGYYAAATEGGKAYDAALTKGTDANGTDYFKIFSEYYITDITVVECDGTNGAAVLHNIDGTKTVTSGTANTAITLPTLTVADFSEFAGWYSNIALTNKVNSRNYDLGKVVHLYAKEDKLYNDTFALTTNTVEKDGKDVTALHYNPVTLDEFIANGGNAEDYAADTYAKPANTLRLGTLVDGKTYKISFSYKSTLMETPFSMNLSAGGASVWPADNYLLGSRYAKYSIPTDKADGEWHTFNIFFTADLNGTVEANTSGLDDVKTAGEKNVLYLYFVQETGESFESFEGFEIDIDMVDFALTEVSGNVITAGGASALNENGAAVAGCQAMRYYFGYETEDGSTIKVGNETFTVNERGFIYANGSIDSYTTEGDYAGSPFTIYNNSLVKSSKNTGFENCWDYVDGEMTFSTYVTSINVETGLDQKLIVRGYITFTDAEGIQHTVYSNTINRSVNGIIGAGGATDGDINAGL